jgi:hypothetical protein
MDMDDDVKQENSDNLRLLKDAICAGVGVVPFVGAGVSVPNGCPEWTAFLLAEAVRADAVTQVRQLLSDGRYEFAADLVLERRGARAFEDAISKAYGSLGVRTRPLQGPIKLLPYICDGSVITTNFDRLLESSFEQAGMKFEDVAYGASPDVAARALKESSRCLLKIHGDVIDGRDRVLTGAQYAQAYGGRQSAVPEAPLACYLSRIWAYRNVLFVGCSLSADRTMEVLKMAFAADATMKHYAILPLPYANEQLPARRRFLSERGIRPIWYKTEQHHEVEVIIKSLADARRSSSRNIPSAASTANHGAHGGRRGRIYLSASWDAHDLGGVVENIFRDWRNVVTPDIGDRVGDDLSHSGIEKLSASCALIVLLTKKTLQTPVVREELARMHALGGLICAIAEQGVTNLPWYVRPLMYANDLKDGTITKALNCVADEIEDEKLSVYDAVLLARTHIQAIHQIWRREIPDTSMRRWQQLLAYEVIRGTAQELESLNTQRYSAYIRRGHNFMTRARPVFECADRVFAVSVDNVSQFWVSLDRADQRVAESYIRAQPPNTHRLFVFDSPESAHNHTTIMNIHVRRYGDTGGVYLCSRKDYDQLLYATGVPGGQHDFAALEYSDCDRGVTTFVATLDADKFSINKEPTQELSKQMDEFKLVLGGFSSLTAGEVDNDSNVMRWSVDMQEKRDIWAKKLKQLFGARKRDVFHMVSISAKALRTPEKREEVVQLVHAIRDMLGRLPSRVERKIRLKDFWVGEALSVRQAARDGATGGRIVNDGALREPLMLWMRFDSEEDLQAWYADEEHSAARRNLYLAFDEEIEQLLSTVSPVRSGGEALYAKIESIAAKYLVRRDYVESDTIDDIVRRRPFRPPFKFETSKECR